MLSREGLLGRCSDDTFEEKVREQEARFESFLGTFLPYTEKIHARSTQEIYKWALEHLRRLTGDIPLSSLTAQHIGLYMP
jgi:hypothetical protein